MALKPDEPEESSATENQQLLKEMLIEIGKSSVIFKSQQIDDPEMCEEDKREVAESILLENPVVFLARFGRFINSRFLPLLETFKTEQNQHDVEFHLTQIKDMLSEDTRRTLTRNRRFEALKRLQSGGKYFSEDEMERREPLLYHQLVGQYLTEAEKTDRFKEANKDAIPSFSSYLIKQADDEAIDRIRKQQEEEEAAEVASSDDEEPMPCSSAEQKPVTKWGADWEDEEAEKKKKLIKGKRKVKMVKISADERALLLEEFKTCLYTKFMDGLDSEFDYNSVDYNPEYDCLQVRSQDEEEKYFDEETCDETLCTDTGIEDY